MGEGFSEVMNRLRVTSSEGTSYSGDLLATLDVLKNITQIFRGAYYSPSSVDMRVRSYKFSSVLFECVFSSFTAHIIHYYQQLIKLILTYTQNAKYLLDG